MYDSTVGVFENDRPQMRLILVRHGETPWNKEGRFQGQSLVGLSQKGIAQAQQVAKALASMNISALYSSPLSRTLMTAQAISAATSVPVVQLDGLKEVNLGELEGITGQVMRSQYPEVYAAWREDPSDLVFPGGESIRQLQQRAQAAIEEIEAAHSEGLVAAVSHNFAIRSILCSFLGMSLSHFHRLRIDLGSLSVVYMDSRSKQVLTINDRCHLSQDPLQE